MLIQEIKDLLNESEEMIAAKNFYYERHDCKVKNENVKVELDYAVKKEKEDKFVCFGLCPYCKTLFYHEDFSGSSF